MNSDLVRLGRVFAYTLLLGWAAGPIAAAAQGFAAFVSPPRVVAQTQPGTPIRQVIDIQHAGNQAGRYRFYTVDWRFGTSGSVEFSSELVPGSCRPWVAIERRELTMGPGDRYRYRFEVSPPADAPVGECRFAIMVEGLDPTAASGDLSIPVSGRIGVIVYVNVGDARAKLELIEHRVDMVNGAPSLVLTVRNQGNAHSRLEGFVDGRDAANQRFELSPQDLPVLPGETRQIPLRVLGQEGNAAPTPRLPMRVSGQLEWDRERLPLELTFAP